MTVFLRTLTLGAALLLSTSADGVEARRLSRSWDREQLGTNARAWIAVEGPDDAVYVGANGVLRFDGERWEALPIPGGYAVRGIAFDPQGRMWVGANGQVGYSERTARGWSDFRSLATTLPPEINVGEVWHVFADAKGASFFTQTHVLRYREGSWRSWPFPGARRLAASEVDGRAWFHHAPTGMWTLEEDGPRRQIPADLLNTADDVVLVTGVGGNVIQVSRRGLFQWNGEQLEPWSAAGTKFVQGNNPTSACTLDDGRVVIATLNGGIGIVSRDGNVVEVIGRDNGLPTPVVFNVNPGRDGLLWCAHPTHLTVLDTGDDVRMYPLAGINALDTANDGLIFSTDEGAFALRAGELRLLTPGFVPDLLATRHGVIADLADEGRARRTIAWHRDAFGLPTFTVTL